ncbi:MAG: RNA methyltransferase, partial [Actinomycetota bacterium]|nr:RNA methyltransferase [Actinomycetota bacterium]
IEGPQAVREALAEGGLLELYAEPGRSPELVKAARAAGVPVVEVAAPVLAAMGETVTPQGLLGVAALLDVPLDEALARPGLVAVLHEVADPGNAGTVLRTADAAGADAVVLTAGSVDAYNGKCVRATAGSLWHLPVVAGVPLDDVLAAARAAGLQVLATSGQGEDDLDDLADGGVLAAPTAWLFGNEAGGLPPASLAAADRQVRVPLHGRAESLNLASAAAVCLYASARARR